MNYEKQTLRFYFIGAALMLLCVFFLPSEIGAYAYPVGMTVSFVCTACLNMLFLIARYPLSGALLKKCLLAFALTAPVAACGRSRDAFIRRVHAGGKPAALDSFQAVPRKKGEENAVLTRFFVLF